MSKTNGKAAGNGSGKAKNLAGLPAPPISFGKIRHAKKRAFLAAFAECGVITKAATLSGVHRDSHRRWRNDDELYAAAFEEAKGCAADYLESEARRRGVEGVQKPVLFQGKQVVIDGKPLTEHVYSDVLLIFLMKGAMPEKYRERHDVGVGGNGTPIAVAVVFQEIGAQDVEAKRVEARVVEGVGGGVASGDNGAGQAGGE